MPPPAPDKTGPTAALYPAVKTLSIRSLIVGSHKVERRFLPGTWTSRRWSSLFTHLSWVIT